LSKGFRCRYVEDCVVLEDNSELLPITFIIVNSCWTYAAGSLDWLMCSTGISESSEELAFEWILLANKKRICCILIWKLPRKVCHNQKNE
jgi:hypothetical protein